MSLKQNPFYVLHVKCSDNRRTISSATEECSFFGDAELCSKANMTLLNPQKRLAAELDWFCDVDENTIESIRNSIDNNLPIDDDSFIGLSALNALLYNFEITTYDDPFEIGFSILDINESFSSLDPSELSIKLSELRQSAGFSEVDSDEVNTALQGYKRDEIKQIITSKLSSLSDDDYIELVTNIAEKAVDISENIILLDIIDQYEIRLNTELEKRTESICEEIQDFIDDPTSVANKKEYILKLVSTIKEWDKFAQPLQLKAQVTGIPHALTNKVAGAVRGLAADLHNENEETELARTLISKTMDVFAENEGILDSYEKDLSTLEGLIKDKAMSDELAEVMELAESIKKLPVASKVYTFSSKLKSLDRKIRGAASLDEMEVEKLRFVICLTARDVAIDLYNVHHKTELSKNLIEDIYDLFSDISALRPKLSVDKATINRNSLVESYNQRQESVSDFHSSMRTIKRVVIGVVVAIFILIGIIDAFSDSESSAADYSSTTRQTTTSNYGNNNYNTTTTTYKYETTTSYYDNLRDEIDDMEQELSSMKSDIDSMESDLQGLQDDLDYYKEQYERTGIQSYYNNFYSTKDEYDSLYSEYQSAIDDYNNLYDEYTDKIAEYNSR